MSTSLTRAQSEWFSRPADERFISLYDLKQSLAMRREISDVIDADITSLKAEARGEHLVLQVGDRRGTPTHWSLTQIGLQIGAPSWYLRTLSVDLIARCLNEGIEKLGSKIRQFLVTSRFSNTDLPHLRALTSPKYGRIWDAEVVEMVEELVESTDGRFTNPPDWSGTPSGLYAGDRDVFLFFIDGGSIVDGGSDRDQLHRGFYVWNSEVGSQQFGFSTFFHRAVCGNHLILGAEDITTLSFRHTKGAPKRFLRDARVALQSHVNTEQSGVASQILAARETRIPADSREAIVEWTEAKGFPHDIALGAVSAAEREEGRCRTLWDLVNGLTSFARSIPNIGSRVRLERQAGLLMPARTQL